MVAYFIRCRQTSGPPLGPVVPSAAMAKSPPKGWHTVTPRLVVHDVPKQVKFLKRAFGATGHLPDDGPAVIRIGDSLVMVSGVDPRPAMPSFLYLYVDDADAVFARTVEAGAVTLESPADMPYGDRRAMIEDPCGNVWQIATFNGARNAWTSKRTGKASTRRSSPARSAGSSRKRRSR